MIKKKRDIKKKYKLASQTKWKITCNNLFYRHCTQSAKLSHCLVSVIF